MKNKHRHDDKATRLDDNETLYFKNQLESIDNTLYETEFPALKGRVLVPQIQGIAPFAKTYSYKLITRFGKAEILGDKQRDLPRAGVTSSDTVSFIKDIGLAYGYSLSEIRAAAQTNTPLDQTEAQACRQGVEEEIDELIAVGSSAHKIYGVINNADVNAGTFVPVTKAAGGGNNTWVGGQATGAEMVSDVNKFVAILYGRLKETKSLPTRYVISVPSAEYARLAMEAYGSNSDRTALQFLLQNNPFIEDIVPWDKLTAAGAASKNRMMGMVRDPRVLGSAIPLDFSPQPVQQVGLEFTVNCIARCGGTVIRYPVAMEYGDGI